MDASLNSVENGKAIKTKPKHQKPVKNHHKENQQRFSNHVIVYEDPIEDVVSNDTAKKTLTSTSRDMSVQTDDVECVCECGNAALQESSVTHDETSAALGEASAALGEPCAEDKMNNDYQLMVQDEVPNEYWQVLIDRRREALKESLQENEQLRVEIAKLEANISQVSELADQEEYFKQMIQVLTDEPDFGEEEAEEKQEPPDEETAPESVSKVLVPHSEDNK